MSGSRERRHERVLASQGQKTDPSLVKNREIGGDLEEQNPWTTSERDVQCNGVGLATG